MRAHVLFATLLMLTTALAGCTGVGAEQRDRDGDGLTDLQETTTRAIKITLQNETVTRMVTSDPALRDTDGDGLEDLEELARNTDPRDIDTDGDGLLDGHNMVLDIGSARYAEFQARGIHESPPGTFLGELDLCPNAYGLRPNEWSSDRPIADELGDGEELLAWSITVRGETRTVVSDPCTPDGDGDGLMDHDEKMLHTDPRLSDTDGDGIADGADADPLWDLGIAFTNIAVTGPAGSVAVSFVLGVREAVASVSEGSPGFANLDVFEESRSRESFNVSFLLTTTDRDTGDPVLLFPSGAQAVLTVDLIKGTVARDGEDVTISQLTFEGSDGTLTFSWETSRT